MTTRPSPKNNLYEFTDETPLSKWEAQAQFFKAVARLAPEVETTLESLCDKDRYPGLDRRRKRVDVSFEKRLQEWAESWHLSDPWCLEKARKFLWDRWQHFNGSNGDEAEWAKLRNRAWDNKEFARALEVPLPAMTLPPWLPDSWSRAGYERLAREHFEAQLQIYCDQIEARAREVGMRPVTQKRGRGRQEHFYWLAGYQVCRWSRQKITEAENLTDRAVAQAINALADEISLTLRSEESHDPAATPELIRQALRAAITPTRN